MPLETRDLDAGGHHVLLEVRRHGDGGAQRPVTLRTPRQALFDEAVDVGGGRAGHPGMPRLLARPLEAMDERGQPAGLALRRVEALGEPLDFLLEAGDPTLLLVDERDELGFRQTLEIGDDGQRPPLSPGLSDTV